MLNDYTDKAVIITGGTKGIGLACGLEFAKRGAHVYLTHRWGSADEDALRARFADLGYREPAIVEADVSNDEDTEALMEVIKKDHDGVEAFISNVCVVQPANGVESYNKRSLLRSLDYSAWPFIAYLQHIEKAFGRLPRYAVGVSSDGADNYFAHYEYVALSKTVMETLCRYASYHLRDEDIRLNIVRSRNALTDAVYEIFGQEYVDFMAKYAGERYFMQPEDIANPVFALCSGLLDAMNGQVLQVDKGMAFADTLSQKLENREELGL